MYLKAVMILLFEVEYSKASGNSFSKTRKAFPTGISCLKFYWLNTALEIWVRLGCNYNYLPAPGPRITKPFP